MAKKPTITTISSGYYSRTALNDNFTNIRDKFDNTLSLDGSTPNTMSADLDLGTNDILNGGIGNFSSLYLNGSQVVPTDTLFTFEGTWLTATAYQVNDVVIDSGSTYLCLVAHTSGTFATDLAASKWVELIDSTAYLRVANNLSDVASAATSRTNLGLGTGDSPTFTGITATGTVSATGGYVETGADSTVTQAVLTAYRAGNGVETGNFVRLRSVGDGAGNANELVFDVNSAEAMRIDSSGNLLVGTTSTPSTLIGTSSIAGSAIAPDGWGAFTRSAAQPLYINRLTDDGQLVSFRQAGVAEGSINVSGTTGSLAGGHLARWSRLPDGTDDSNIHKGTVMTNLNEKVVWDGEDNEQLNYTTVSSVEGDKDVAGVFVDWDKSDEWGDYFIAMTGDMIIRIASGTTVERGDLLMSAGDGTAKPQGDDVVRSKTIAKVISTEVTCTYADGSYCVPCVLMAC